MPSWKGAHCLRLSYSGNLKTQNSHKSRSLGTPCHSVWTTRNNCGGGRGHRPAEKVRQPAGTSGWDGLVVGDLALCNGEQASLPADYCADWEQWIAGPRHTFLSLLVFFSLELRALRLGPKGHSISPASFLPQGGLLLRHSLKVLRTAYRVLGSLRSPTAPSVNLSALFASPPLQHSWGLPLGLYISHSWLPKLGCLWSR
jgi:hypothetical protein